MTSGALISAHACHPLCCSLDEDKYYININNANININNDK